METKELLSRVLVKTLNLTEAEVSSLYNEDGTLKEDAQATVDSKHTEIVAKAKALGKQDREAAFARGIKEKASDMVAILKEAGVEIGKEEGDELATLIKEQIAAKAKPSELEEDKVKTHPAYTKREKELLAQINAKEQEKVAALAERDAKDQRERTLSKVKQRAEELKSVLKPVLPEDEKIAKSQLRLLDLDINSVEYETEEDGTILLKKDGKRLEKANGHPMSLDEYLEESIKGNFQIQVSEKKGSAGDVTKDTIKGSVKLAKPATRKALADQLYAISEDATLKPDQKAAMVAELQEMSKDLA